MAWHLVESDPGYLAFWSQDAPPRNVARALSGRVYAVYYYMDDYTNPGAPTTQSLRLARSDDLVVWNYTWIPFTQAFHYLTRPGIAVDGNGNVYVVYSEYEALWVERLILAKFDADCNLLSQEEFLINSDRYQGFETLPSICIDASNDVHIAYHVYAGHLVGDISKLLYVKRTAAGVWGAIVELESEAGPWSYRHPIMCIDVDGVTPHLIYFYEKWLALGSSYYYRYIHAWENGGWNKEVVHEHLPEEETVKAWNFIATSPDGKVHISYKTGKPINPKFYYRSKDVGVWSAPSEITDTIDSVPWAAYTWVYAAITSGVFFTAQRSPATDDYVPWMHRTALQDSWTALGAGGLTCGIVNDANFIYVCGSDNPVKVYKVDKATMGTVDTFNCDPGENSCFQALVQDDTYLYVGLEESPARVVKIRKSDMARIDFWEGGLGEDFCEVLTEDDNYIYAGLDTTPAKVVKISKATMATVAVWTGAPVGEDSCYGLTEDTDYVYVSISWVDPAKVIKVSKSTMTTSLIWTGGVGEGSAWPVVQDADYVYVGLGISPGRVVKIDKATMTTSDFWESALADECGSLSIDDDYIYVGSSYPTSVFKVLKSTMETWYAGTADVFCWSLDQDSDFVYAGLDAGDPTVMKILKPIMEDHSTKIGVPAGKSNDSLSVLNALFPVSGASRPSMPTDDDYNSHMFLMMFWDEDIWLWGGPLLPPGGAGAAGTGFGGALELLT